MLLTRRWALGLLLSSCCYYQLLAQEDLQPVPMTDPLRALRVQQRDAWQKLYRSLRERDRPEASLSAAWALFHQFDVDYFTLLEDDGKALLQRYETETKGFLKSLDVQAKQNKVAQLAAMELEAQLDDLYANKLQNERPEGLAVDAPEMESWSDKVGNFQKARATALQERGKLVLALYRAGEVDVTRLCLVLLERQIAERVLLEHQEMNAGAKNAKAFAERRSLLLDKQRREWRQMRELLPNTDAKAPQVPLGEQICNLQLLSLDLGQSRLTGNGAQEGDAKEAEDRIAGSIQEVLEAFQKLHRAAAAQFAAGRLSVEDLARMHDLRMYTTIWTDPAASLVDVIADGIEVAALWDKLHAQLAGKDPDSIDTQIALAKKIETDIARQERQGPAPETKAAEPKPTDAPK